MKVIMCHDYYVQPGGEDQVYHDEVWLLEKYGHEVIRYEKHNSAIQEMSKLSVARSAIWNSQVNAELTDLIRKVRPDIIHFHNTFPLISASAYSAAHAHHVPVIQTLHNFRKICPGSTLFRESKVCEKCVGKVFAWPGVWHGCYRGSRFLSGLVATSNAASLFRGTWKHKVDRFIALTQHSRQVFIRAGLPEDRIRVKPNFVRPDPGPQTRPGQGAIFVGRLSPEKGVDVLLDAWTRYPTGVELTIAGDGPLRGMVEQAAASHPGIEYLGQLPFEQVLEKIRAANMLIMPSVWYETFGRTMIEAFAAGIPVIASNLGSMQEVVGDGATGLHFQPGCGEDLARKVRCLASNENLRRSLADQSRQEFVKKYTTEKNYELLMNIYEQARFCRVNGQSSHDREPDAR